MAASLGRAGLLMKYSPNTTDYRTAVSAALLVMVAAVWVAAQTPASPAARTLHARSLVFDGHVHAVDRVFYHGGDIGELKADGQFDLPRAKAGGLGALFFSIFVTEDYYPARFETKQALR